MEGDCADPVDGRDSRMRRGVVVAMKTALVALLLLCASSLSAAPITAQGSTTYTVQPAGWNTNRWSGEAIYGQPAAGCSNPEWNTCWSGNPLSDDTLLFNGAEDGRTLWSYDLNVEAGQTYQWRMDVASLGTRYASLGPNPILALIFEYGGVAWESGHITGQDDEFTSWWSTYYAEHGGVLRAYVVDLEHSFERNDGMLRVDVSQPAVPEPQTLVLLGMGLIGIARRVRRTWA